MMFKGIIFDLDGTLLNTLDDIGHYINVILKRYSYPPFPLEKTNTVVGWGLKEALRKIIPPEDSADDIYLTKMTKELIAEYNSDPVIKTVPYPGIPELLDELANRKVMMSIFSNKSHPVTLNVVDKIFGLERFHTILGSDAGFPRKPDPAGAIEVIRRMGLDKSEIFYVGDTMLDHQVALGAGLADISVTWGFRTKEKLIRHGITDFVDKPEEILKYF